MRESLIYFKNLKLALEPFVSIFLAKDSLFLRKLKDLDLALEKSRSALRESKAFDFCKACGAEGGTCCGEGLEWKLRPEEFFLNLCLFYWKKRSLILEDFQENTCLFLGERGCKLELVPLLCRNFFCRELSDFLGIRKLREIQAFLGDEANISFQLCEYVKGKLRDEGLL